MLLPPVFLSLDALMSSVPPAVSSVYNRIRNNPVWLALILVVLLVLWMLSGQTYRAQTDAPEDVLPPDTVPSRVETRQLQAQPYAPVQVVQGQLLPVRAVNLRSQAGGRLLERPVALGDRVARDDLLIRLDQENRPAQLARAEADLTLREAELRAGQRLFDQQLMPETDFIRLRAAKAAAQAERNLMAIQLDYTQIRAPFDGVVDLLPAEEGDMIQVGETLATLVDLSSLKLTAQIPQQRIHVIEPGLSVQATLLDGSTLDGTLTFVAHMADPETRSFRVEARLDNPDNRRVAGASATLQINLPEQPAHTFSPALLVLGDDGQLGVKVVDQNQRVAVKPVRILSLDTQAVWVTGLPETVELITLGGGFYQAGESVTPVRQES